MKLMCPVGYILDREADQCELMEGNICSGTTITLSIYLGYECCPEGHYVCDKGPYVRCYQVDNDDQDLCGCLVTNVLSAGIVMSGYKEQCHANFIWVDWRKKCLRRS